MKKFLVVISIVFFFNSNSYADQHRATIGGFIELYDKSNAEQKRRAEKDFFLTGQGMLISNTELESLGRVKLYCQPDTLAITGNQYFSIFRRFLEKHKGLLSLETKGLGTVLMLALKDTFPCK